MRLALTFARERAGNSIDAKMAIMAMTTSNSIKVSARAKLLPVRVSMLGFDAARFRGIHDLCDEATLFSCRLVPIEWPGCDPHSQPRKRKNGHASAGI